ncbi:Citrate/H+ symporter of CitMHS family [Cytobacillus firmus]|uniref:Citrate/H+ symporter of CitMHS family n=1 Tax=Cytobacillus firmus TaxID=1399 RepID=A0A800N8V8_CYTFI|nr:Citrate/H+ symporter of CitMHS family [Cytobacillus firmus]
MLALLGYCMVAVFMALIMTKRMSALLALIIVPIIFMLATLALLSIGVMNMTPWGGPTASVISSLQLTTEEVFLPLIPVMAAGILFAFLAAWYFGIKERKRIGIRQMDDSAIRELQAAEEQVAAAASRETLTDLQRPQLIWVNAGLTIALLIALIAGLLPLPVLFMLGFAIAAMINYPNLVQQKERVAAHAGNVLAVVALVFASGIFTGIMNGTEMVDAMATALVQVIPDQLGSQACHLRISWRTTPIIMELSRS